MRLDTSIPFSVAAFCFCIMLLLLPLRRMVDDVLESRRDSSRNPKVVLGYPQAKASVRRWFLGLAILFLVFGIIAIVVGLSRAY